MAPAEAIPVDLPASNVVPPAPMQFNHYTPSPYASIPAAMPQWTPPPTPVIEKVPATLFSAVELVAYRRNNLTQVGPDGFEYVFIRK